MDVRETVSASILSLKQRKFFIQTLITFMLLVLVPFVAMSIIVYEQLKHNIEQEINATNQNALNRTQEVVDTFFEQTQRLGQKYAGQPEVEEFAVTSAPDSYLNMLYEQIMRSISIFSPNANYIDSIYIYSSSTNYIISNHRSGPVDLFEDPFWSILRKRLPDKGASYAWDLIEMNTGQNPSYFLTLMVPVRSTGSSITAGWVGININMEKFKELWSIKESFFILDRSNRVVFSNNQMAFSDQMLAIVGRNQGENTKIGRINDRMLVVSEISSLSDKWKYLLVIPLNHYQYQLSRLQLYFIVLLLSGMLIIAVISIYLTYRTYKPIRQMLALVQNPDSWRKKGAAKGILQNVEKPYSDQALMELELNNRMSLLRQTQAAALQYQVNPDFLRKAFEAIGIMTRRLSASDTNEITVVLSSINEMVSFSLKTDGHLISLADEMVYVKKYIDIMKIRYKEKIDVIWQVGEEYRTYKVVHPLLQPLIENAINHGIRLTRKRGTIWITADAYQADYIIEIRDNGAGMSEEKLQELNRGLEQTPFPGKRHIGLFNVNQRIKLIFGDNYGITLSSVQGQGTAVRIWLPKVTG